ncbi:MAG: hypothetical protein QG639_57 [Patescibacteria group bacterium]|nr:hypothetical protein [Patescibacteria group bacterium]
MKYKLSLFISLFLLFGVANVASADQTSKLGIHILNTGELTPAEQLLQVEGSDQWQYVTIPFTLDDTQKLEDWQAFFDEAKRKKIIPLVRLTTRFEDGAWQVPNRRQLVLLVTALGHLDWPTDQKHIIVFNEVNHSKEWGGTIDPEEYAGTLEFVSNWARSENKNFVILPAAMDLAAPNGYETKEAFTYLNEMYKSDPEIFSYIDAWNSHSYPNPGFSSSPQRTGKNSLRGFEHELSYLKQKTNKDFDVYITETGWEDNRTTARWLTSYYNYAMQHIWSNPQVKAVTPFVLKGSPGPFAGFSFLSGDDKPTRQYIAFRNMIETLAQQQRLLTDASTTE